MTPSDIHTLALSAARLAQGRAWIFKRWAALEAYDIVSRACRKLFDFRPDVDWDIEMIAKVVAMEAAGRAPLRPSRASEKAYELVAAAWHQVQEALA